MRKKYYTIKRSLLIAVTVSILTCCIRPDLSGCVDPRGNVRLTVKLDANATSGQSTKDFNISSAHVYVFDADKRFVTSADGGELAEDACEFFFNLPGGDYDFVIWTNRGDIYKVNHDASYCESKRPHVSELIFYMDNEFDNHLVSGVPDLFHGSVTNQTITENLDNHVEVPIVPLTNAVNIKVKGLPVISDEFSFVITDNNSHYKFDNSIIDQLDSFDHIRTCRQQNGELNASIKTLKMDNDRSPEFVLYNKTSGDQIFRGDLVKMIQNAMSGKSRDTTPASVDFYNNCVFNIVLTYDNDMNVTITVNGWDYEPENPDLE